MYTMNQLTIIGFTGNDAESHYTANGSDLAPDIQNNAGNEIPRQYLSAALAREVLGWLPNFTLEEGLRKTIVCTVSSSV